MEDVLSDEMDGSIDFPAWARAADSTGLTSGEAFGVAGGTSAGLDRMTHAETQSRGEAWLSSLRLCVSA